MKQIPKETKYDGFTVFVVDSDVLTNLSYREDGPYYIDSYEMRWAVRDHYYGISVF